jgi:acyl carrier protein
MNINTIEERVIKVTTQVLGIKWHSQVHSESNFSLDLGADSLDTAELVMSMEDEFDIEIPDTDSDTIFTIKEATAYINQKVELRK